MNEMTIDNVELKWHWMTSRLKDYVTVLQPKTQWSNGVSWTVEEGNKHCRTKAAAGPSTNSNISKWAKKKDKEKHNDGPKKEKRQKTYLWLSHHGWVGSPPPPVVCRASPQWRCVLGQRCRVCVWARGRLPEVEGCDEGGLGLAALNPGCKQTHRLPWWSRGIENRSPWSPTWLSMGRQPGDTPCLLRRSSTSPASL